MLDDLIGGAISGGLEAAEVASNMSEAHSRKTFVQGCLLNLLGLLMLIGSIPLLFLGLMRDSILSLVGAGVALLVAVCALCYSYYVRKMRPSWEDLD